MTIYTGTSSGEYLAGTAADDTINGLGGNDQLRGNEGSDHLNGGDGDDILAPDTVSIYDDHVSIGILLQSVSDGAADYVDGGAGFDSAVLRLDTVTAGITANFTDWAVKQTLADGSTVVNVEQIAVQLGSGNDNVTFGSFNDTAYGGGGDDHIAVGAGNDYVDGGDGHDTLSGGDGADVLHGQAGDDVLDGGSGDDGLYGESGADQLSGGAGDDQLNGGDGNDFLIGGAGNDTLVDGAGDDSVQGGDGNDYIFGTSLGTDVYDGGAGVDHTQLAFSNAVSGVTFALDDGAVANTQYGTKTLYGIEGADIYGSVYGDTLSGGSASDNLSGSSGDDFLNGRGGNDQLFGDDGNDTLAGGDGDDYLVGGIGTDALYGGAGIDTTYLAFFDASAGVTFTLDEGVIASTDYGTKYLYGIDAVQATGSTYDDTFTGGVGPDSLQGQAGNDTLNGLGGDDALYGQSGDDHLYGGDGNDFLDGGSGTDLLDGGAGTDVAYLDFSGLALGVSFTLADGVVVNTTTGTETLVAIETVQAYGTDHDDAITGGIGNDKIYGQAGNDTLNGGAGDDYLDGGIGNDTLNGGAGVDSTGLDFYGGASGVSFALVDGAVANTANGTKTLYGIESATINGTDFADTITGGTGNDSFFGFDGNDQLNGSTGADRLDGGAGNDTLNGGAGADAMSGGLGDDTYYVDNAADSITEYQLQGTDLVRSSVSFILGDNVENLQLTGTAAINGTGNALNNAITGNAAANVLNGGAGTDTLNGGAGADTMYGDVDNDTYVVDNALDQAIETSATGGIDLVKSSVGFTLGANLENLTLIGSAAINGTGNSLANTLVGNDAANGLNGGAGNDTLGGGGGADSLHGGAGNDSLTGGTGADNFYFESALSASTNVDKIIDFSTVDDTIRLDNHIFTAAGVAGTLSANAFFTGAAAHDADDRIVYNSAAGNIYYDADGNGAGAAVLFAHVTAGTALTNADFVVVGTSAPSSAADTGSLAFADSSQPWLSNELTQGAWPAVSRAHALEQLGHAAESFAHGADSTPMDWWSPTGHGFAHPDFFGG